MSIIWEISVCAKFEYFCASITFASLPFYKQELFRSMNYKFDGANLIKKKWNDIQHNLTFILNLARLEGFPTNLKTYLEVGFFFVELLFQLYLVPFKVNYLLFVSSRSVLFWVLILTFLTGGNFKLPVYIVTVPEMIKLMEAEY